MSKASHHAQYYSGGAGLTQTAILSLLQMQGYDPYAWFGQKKDVYPVRAVPYQRILWVVEGTITIQLPEEGQEFNLSRGDRLDLAAGIPHTIVIRSQRSICIEAYGDQPVRRPQSELQNRHIQPLGQIL